jgi:hypothetical protein
MAQGTQEHRGGHEPVGFTFTQAELNAALKARGFRIHEGYAYGEQDGALFKIVAPTSPLAVAHGYAEFVRNRVVANRNGVSPESAAAAAASGTVLPNAKSNDAFDSVYRDRIAELTDAAKGWDDAAIKAMTAAEKLERNKLIESNAASEKNKAKYYDATIRAALEAGRTAGAKRETKRTPGKRVEAQEL